MEKTGNLYGLLRWGGGRLLHRGSGGLNREKGLKVQGRAQRGSNIRDAELKMALPWGDGDGADQ